MPIIYYYHIASNYKSYDTTSILSIYNGAAIESKLIFIQLMSENGEFAVPDLLTGYFNYSYTMGSRIHSNSWGVSEPANYYSIAAMDIDQFVHEYQDYLIIFAAGNGGVTGLSQESTAKNSITVGSSISSIQHFTGSISEYLANSTEIEISQTIVCQSWWPNQDTFNSINNLIKSTAIVANTNNNNDDDDGPFTNPIDMHNYYCSLIELNPNNWCCEFYNNSNTNSRQHAFTELTESSLRASCCDSRYADWFLSHSPDGNINQYSTAYFSSVGPTADQRRKPDLLAPGHTVLSSKSRAAGADIPSCLDSDINNLIFPMAGTSCSSPLTAGTAALVRQYYIEGWHINGWRNDSLSLWPSAAALKATLISSAVSLTNYSYYSSDESIYKLNLPNAESLDSITDRHSIDNTPITRLDKEGYGEIVLFNTLYFNHNNNNDSNSNSNSNTNTDGNTNLLPKSPQLFIYDICTDNNK